MTDFIISVDENKLAAIREHAEREGTTIEVILTRLVDGYLEEQSPSEAKSEFDNWAGIGFFKGSSEPVGRNADEIIEAGWEPDQRG
jgi:hypothetical protein